MRTITTVTAVLGLLSCAAALPARVVSPAPPQVSDDRPDIDISKADRDLAIGNLAKTIREQHFSVAEGERIAKLLERRWRAGRFNAITGGRMLAATLTSDLRSISGDQHFLIDYFFRARPFPTPPTDSAAELQQRQDFALDNFGIKRAERLEGNIGYLRLDKFAPAKDAGAALLGAMTLLNSTSALIIDLRYNGGGYSDGATLLAAQLLSAPAHLSDIVKRDGITQNWTPVVLGARYVNKPVYILTSAHTFSAAEGFTYDLRALGRVKVVGETTRGGANPVTRTLLSSRFWVLVPTAQAHNAATGGNWEGTGVTPDIRSQADQALAVAQKDAAAQLLGRHSDDAITRELQALLAAN